jgi:hypothetical protein
MKPGDIVMYEGASTMHGRKDPLKGDQFTNIFFHFRTSKWLPAVTAKLDKYWDQRGEFERASGRHLTSLGEADKLELHWKSSDQCMPIRSRTDPLMPYGHFMDLPPADTWDPKQAKKPHIRTGKTKSAHLKRRRRAK